MFRFNINIFIIFWKMSIISFIFFIINHIFIFTSFFDIYYNIRIIISRIIFVIFYFLFQFIFRKKIRLCKWEKVYIFSINKFIIIIFINYFKIITSIASSISYVFIWNFLKIIFVVFIINKIFFYFFIF